MRGGAGVGNTKSTIFQILTNPSQSASAATEMIFQLFSTQSQAASAANELAVAKELSNKMASAAALPIPQKSVTGALIAGDTNGKFLPIGEFRFASNYASAKGTIGVGSGNTWLTLWDGGYTKNQTWYSIQVGQISADNFPAWQTIKDAAGTIGNNKMITDGNSLNLGDKCMYFKFSNASGTSEIILRNCFSRVLDGNSWVLLCKVNLRAVDGSLPRYPGIHSYRGNPITSDTYTLSVAFTTPYVAPATAPPVMT